MHYDLRRPFQTAPDHPGFVDLYSVHYVTLFNEWLFYVDMTSVSRLRNVAPRPIPRLLNSLIENGYQGSHPIGFSSE
jgi:hypothetical protein